MDSQKIIEEGKLSLKIDNKVISHLSIGLYKNFSRAIKELVSNAYDADATEVKINLDIKKRKLYIKDNGKGMNKEKIEEKLLTIGSMTSRKDENIGLGRKRIGQFGVGFLAVFPYCKTVRVVSKKKGEKNAIEVMIQVNKYFQNNSWIHDPEEKDIDYKITPSLLPEGHGETIIVLEEIEDHIIANELNKLKGSGYSSIEQYGGFEKTKWELQQYLPLQFPSRYPELINYFKVEGRVPLRVWFDGEELIRNVAEGPKNKKSEILEKGEKTFGSVIVKYAILSPYTSINPREARGFQLRLNDVGIGLPTDFDVMKLKRVLGKIHYFSGEIDIISGLDSDLMLDRDGFYYTKEVSNIYEFFRNKLTQWEGKLQTTAKEDKEAYETLSKLTNESKYIEEFKKAGIIKLDKASLRIKKNPITKTRKAAISNISRQLDSILTKKGFKVERKKASTDLKKSIEINKASKVITIFEDEKTLSEKIVIDGNEFLFKYDTWDREKHDDPICDIDYQKYTAVFNKNHPLFKTSLSNSIIVELILRLKTVSMKNKLSIDTLNKIYGAIERTFSK
ncbi:MAG: ATP-binding protein [Candidatus Micrarchaeota archaeon]